MRIAAAGKLQVARPSDGMERKSVKDNAGGRSDRTPYKHWVLNSHLGKIVGVLTTGRAKVPAIARPLSALICVLATGFALMITNAVLTSSPKHCEWLQRYSPEVSAKSVFIEKHQNTFEQLEKNVECFVQDPGFRRGWRKNDGCDRLLHEVELRNEDSRDFVLDQTLTIRQFSSTATQTRFQKCHLPNHLLDR